MVCHSTQTRKNRLTLGIGRPAAESSKSGTASPIVSFRQVRSVVSILDGSAVAVAFSSPDSAAVSLYPSSVSATLLARKYCTTCSGNGSDAVALNSEGVVEELEAIVQFAEMDAMSAATVLLSDTTWKVVFCVLDENAAWARGPPGREELLGSPY